MVELCSLGTLRLARYGQLFFDKTHPVIGAEEQSSFRKVFGIQMLRAGIGFFMARRHVTLGTTKRLRSGRLRYLKPWISVSKQAEVPRLASSLPETESNLILEAI